MKPDVGLIAAVQRIQTGAEIHRVNNLLHLYLCACYGDDSTVAKRTKQQLIAFVTEKNRSARSDGTEELPKRVYRPPA